MFKSKSAIKPYGRDWNGDRSASDYDPQRDPWNPESPVYGRWPRPKIFHEFVLTSPVFWAFGAWFTATISLIALYHLGLISNDAFTAGLLARYAVLLVGLAIAGIWSLVMWVRKTPARERGPAVVLAIKRIPGFLAWFILLCAVIMTLDWLEKRHRVSFFLSSGVALAVYLASLWAWTRFRKPAADTLEEEHERKVIEILSNDPADAETLAMYPRTRACCGAVECGSQTPDVFASSREAHVT